MQKKIQSFLIINIYVISASYTDVAFTSGNYNEKGR